jgi:collagenase-like PrtC family protease
VLSSQALIESEAELRTLRRLSEHGEFMIEANEAAGVRIAAGRPFVIGPHLNAYSAPALDEFAAVGAVRWVPPMEVPVAAIPLINPATRTPAIETEVFAFGRIGLAFSARCFTARHYSLNRDECDFRCIEHPDGLLVKTQEGDPFLALNGLQTQSARVHCLLADRAALAQAGVRRIRLSPIAQHFERVIDAFDRVFNQGADAMAAMKDLVPMLPGQPADGYAHRRAGYEWSHA